MKAELISFGLIDIDGHRFDHDVVVERDGVRKRKKGPSKAYRDRFGHTPLSVDEDIPWTGSRLIIGTGYSGQLPVMDEVYEAARRRGSSWWSNPRRARASLSTSQAMSPLRRSCM